MATDDGHVKAVLGAAPRVRLFAADVHCFDPAVAHRLLRNKGAFSALRVRKLSVSARAHDTAGMLTFAADLAAHTSLTEVRLHYAPLGTLAALNAAVDAARMLRLDSLTLIHCAITPASAPALARLISGGALTDLQVHNTGVQLLDQPAAALIADALRANSTLTSLKLDCCRFGEDAAAAALVMGALTAHRTLRALHLCLNEMGGGDLAPILGALVAADAPALHELHVSSSRLGDAGLGPLVDALTRNTHLRVLACNHDHMSEAFARDQLLPAVRANTSLQCLMAAKQEYQAADGGAPIRRPFASEAEALVDARRAAAP